MARRLPPPEEFRRAGPRREGVRKRPAVPPHWKARSCSTPLRGWPATGSPPFLPSRPGEEARWPLPPHRPVRNAGPRFPFHPPNSDPRTWGGGEKGRAGPISGGRIRDRLRGKRGKARAACFPPLRGTPHPHQTDDAAGRTDARGCRSSSVDPTQVPVADTAVARTARCASLWARRGPRPRCREPPGALGAHFRCTARGPRNRRGRREVCASGRRGVGIACGPRTRAPEEQARGQGAGARSRQGLGCPSSDPQLTSGAESQLLGPRGKGRGRPETPRRAAPAPC